MIYLALGANISGPAGPPETTIAAALKRIVQRGGLTLERASRVYRTEPQHVTAQPWFLNQVAAFKPGRDADMTPESLLEVLHAVEMELGRDRTWEIRFGPRSLDLDLLLFDNVVINTPRLTLPHPRMLERAFVLVPLKDIAPDLVLPTGESVQAALAELRYSVHNDVIRQ
ncbi:2-amino-4-hydroxy-6-hydroxymethyldihydropteridine diphosphokinase [Oceanidesulfovibrio indonesiensis]|uniref:2-amino-4-hydroxy-6-hydroxymethyldihydropteridine pyrophosphokinase n=1 Tax=Oceanidesulfovibrio indonesiensis TaxID=54767 RepID=A0A7M3MBQ1_9BACT|nr:2-amino-4-hydroxy-6-hydroxymethyldihydropteridine diphosphokinase [Oceanidesulfovibrio indonesiensis]TVM15651.1 2-amino-4-hydroxy-6-hydroxymethyldihydropteridine diphosphokinase [Oceanidesulfovibrio indonesiensis]